MTSISSASMPSPLSALHALASSFRKVEVLTPGLHSCDACRQQRKRCDRQEAYVEQGDVQVSSAPAVRPCERCALLGIPCTYERKVLKAGRPTNAERAAKIKNGLTGGRRRNKSSQQKRQQKEVKATVQATLERSRSAGAKTRSSTTKRGPSSSPRRPSEAPLFSSEPKAVGTQQRCQKRQRMQDAETIANTWAPSAAAPTRSGSDDPLHDADSLVGWLSKPVLPHDSSGAQLDNGSMWSSSSSSPAVGFSPSEVGTESESDGVNEILRLLDPFSPPPYNLFDMVAAEPSAAHAHDTMTQTVALAPSGVGCWPALGTASHHVFGAAGNLPLHGYGNLAAFPSETFRQPQLLLQPIRFDYDT